MHHPVDYARVVMRIANEMDLTLVNLDDILPAATVMVVTVTGVCTSTDCRCYFYQCNLSGA